MKADCKIDYIDQQLFFVKIEQNGFRGPIEQSLESRLRNNWQYGEMNYEFSCRMTIRMVYHQAQYLALLFFWYTSKISQINAIIVK